MNTRAIATELMTEILTKGHSLSEQLPRFKTKCKNEQDAAFLQALSFGVIRWYPRLCFLANQLLEKPLKEKDRDLFYLILIGLYQLTNMQVPEYAALKETVEATKILKKSWGAGLVNAILRNYQRQAKTLQASLSQNDEAYYAHPQWWIDSLKKSWPSHWQALLENNNKPPPLSIRINQQQQSREQYLEILKKENIEATSIPYTKNGIVITSPINVSYLPGFTEGYFCVQDGASQLVCDQLALSPNLRVLDACSAPGGKTTHILESEPNLETLIAVEISKTRTQTIQENLKRLQLNATVITADASNPSTWWDQKLFDRILLDAPCSASGVIRRHPDIKYLRKLTDIPQLHQQQLQLLKALWSLLKPGGLLVYTTCSVFPEENVQTIESFLSQHNAESLPLSIPIGLAQPVGHQLLSGENGMDGFYYACLKKTMPKDL